MILYLHGFNSSAASFKGRLTETYCRRLGIDCQVPDLPHRPAEAIALAQTLCENASNVVAVGSSLGGYYATWLVENGHASTGVLINPAVAAASKLASQVGQEQENYNTQARYIFTQQHVAELEALALPQVSEAKRYLLLVKEGDEVLDYQEAVAYYEGARQIVEPGGDHFFVDFERHLPSITQLALTGVRSNPLLD